jgi:hypothetical protein
MTGEIDSNTLRGMSASIVNQVSMSFACNEYCSAIDLIGITWDLSRVC